MALGWLSLLGAATALVIALMPYWAGAKTLESLGMNDLSGEPYLFFGSIAGSESLLVAFGDDYVPSALMAEAAHGTAPSLEGKNVANPMAMILAGASLLSHADEEDLQEAGRAIREACLEAVADGIRTPDLGGHHGTREFTDDVIRRTKTKLEIWSSL